MTSKTFMLAGTPDGIGKGPVKVLVDLETLKLLGASARPDLTSLVFVCETGESFVATFCSVTSGCKMWSNWE